MRSPKLLRAVRLVLAGMLLGAAGLVPALVGRESFVFGDTSFLRLHERSLLTAFPVLELGSNAYFSYRFEPLTRALCAPFGVSAFFGCWYLLLAISICGLLRYLSPAPVSHRAAIATLGSFVLFRWFGFHLAAVTVATSVSLELLACAWARHAKPPPNVYRLVFAAAGLFVALSTSHLALIPLLVSMAYSLGVGTEHPERYSAAIAFSIPALILLLFTGMPDFPLYEQGGHVVSHYGTADGLFPLVGEAPPVLTVDRQVVRRALLEPALCLLALTCLVSLGVLRDGERERGMKALAGLALVLAVSLALESSLVDIGTSQIAPLQSVSRLVPNWFVSPLASVTMASLVVLIIALAAERSWTIGLLAVAFGALAGHSGMLFVDARDEALWKRIENEPNVVLRTSFEAVASSPSYAVLRDHGLAVLENRSFWRRLQYESAASLSARIRASHNEAELPAMLDGSRDTAWSTRTGSQDPGEWILLELPAPARLSAVKLDSGRLFTDFPRRLEVRGGDRCPAEPSKIGELRVLAPSTANEGEILYTADGFPYYASQYSASALFPPGTMVSCLLVRQTGTDPNFDWSVSELLVARENPPD